MTTILIKPDGVLLDDRLAEIHDPLPFFSSRIELADQFSLRSYFRIVERYPTVEKLNSFFPHFLEQYRLCPKDGCNTTGYDYLEFGKTIEMVGFPGDPRIDIYHSLYGVTGNDTAELKSSRLEGILDLPLRLGKLKHVIFGDKVDIFKFETVYNLFDFMDGVAWELSFHGTPDTCDIRR